MNLHTKNKKSALKTTKQKTPHSPLVKLIITLIIVTIITVTAFSIFVIINSNTNQDISNQQSVEDIDKVLEESEKNYDDTPIIEDNKPNNDQPQQETQNNYVAPTNYQNTYTPPAIEPAPQPTEVVDPVAQQNAWCNANMPSVYDRYNNMIAAAEGQYNSAVQACSMSAGHNGGSFGGSGAICADNAKKSFDAKVQQIVFEYMATAQNMNCDPYWSPSNLQ